MSLFDPFQPVIPGTAKQPIAARTWNGLLKAGQANSRSKFDLTTGQGGSPTDPALTLIVRNDTGGYLSSQSILRPVDALVDPSQLPDQSQQQPVFTGQAVAAATDPFVVTTEIAGDGCFVESVVSGLAVCSVVISDASHKRAVPVAGVTTHLVSAASGGVPIWWTPGGTGTKVCLVLLSGDGGSLPSSVVTSAATSLVVSGSLAGSNTGWIWPFTGGLQPFQFVAVPSGGTYEVTAEVAALMYGSDIRGYFAFSISYDFSTWFDLVPLSNGPAIAIGRTQSSSLQSFIGSATRLLTMAGAGYISLKVFFYGTGNYVIGIGDTGFDPFAGYSAPVCIRASPVTQL